jgi:hypothetical protein
MAANHPARVEFIYRKRNPSWIKFLRLRSWLLGTLECGYVQDYKVDKNTKTTKVHVEAL